LDRGKYEHLNSDYTTEIRYSPDEAQIKIEEAYSSMGPELKIGKNHELANYLEHLMFEKSYSPDAALGEIKTVVCDSRRQSAQQRFIVM